MQKKEELFNRKYSFLSFTLNKTNFCGHRLNGKWTIVMEFLAEFVKECNL